MSGANCDGQEVLFAARRTRQGCRTGSKGRTSTSCYSLENLKAFSAPTSAADLRGLIAQSIVELRTGTLDPRLANSISYLGACFLRALEMSDLEARLQALKAHAEKEGDGEPQR